MIDAIMEVAKGDYSVQIELSGENDDLDALAMGLNMMTDDVRTSYQELEAAQEASLNIMEDLDRQGKELEAINKRLRHEIAERKRAEEQLERYAAELERANRELRDFTYIVSHDLRAPLINLKGFAGELHQACVVVRDAMEVAWPHLRTEQRQAVTRALQEDVPEALEFIDASATRMDQLIRALLKLSRVGRRDINLTPIDMDALVEETLQTLAHQIEEGQVRVTVAPLPQVVADRTSMEQIMANLLSNAVLYLDRDRPGEIEISGERGREETTLRVRDNGRGIAEHDMDKVFAPFRRAGRQDKPGEGMGLAYVQALVGRHGGRIWCESELGVGTTFTFTIPNHLGKGGDHAQAAGSDHSLG